MSKHAGTCEDAKRRIEELEETNARLHADVQNADRARKTTSELLEQKSADIFVLASTERRQREENDKLKGDLEASDQAATKWLSKSTGEAEETRRLRDVVASQYRCTTAAEAKGARHKEIAERAFEAIKQVARGQAFCAERTWQVAPELNDYPQAKAHISDIARIRQEIGKALEGIVEEACWAIRENGLDPEEPPEPPDPDDRVACLNCGTEISDMEHADNEGRCEECAAQEGEGR